MTDLLNAGHVAARLIDERGLVQGILESETGEVCAERAALLACTVPGDGHLFRQVVIYHWRAGADFNDADGRTSEEVRARLDRDVTEEDLAATFGPQWREIVALARRAATLTSEEVRALTMARAESRAAARVVAPIPAQDTDTEWDAAWDAVCDAACDAVWGATVRAAGVVARDTAWALAVRDLIGQHGFTQEHYDTLTRPWRQVIGPVHPDDA